MKALLTVSSVLVARVFLLAAGHCTAQVTDIDGNNYDTVVIGNQAWLKSNLRATHYNDGTLIPNVPDSAAWAGLQSGARCYYNNDSAANDSVYGALYNWYAVVNSKKLCPAGWHAPTDGEWTILENYLGGAGVAGGPLKEAGILHWLSPNAGATNSTGFTGLPAGARGLTHIYEWMYENAFFWTATANGASAWSRYLWYMNAGVDRNPTPKKMGASLRCVKDEGAAIGETSSAEKAFFYPNPAKDFIIVHCRNGNSNELLIYQITGQLLLKRILLSGEHRIDISGLQPGQYLIELKAGAMYYKGKFLVK